LRLARLLCLLLLLSLPAHATWTLVQFKQSAACTTTSQTCSFTGITSTGANHVIVVFMGVAVNAEVITAISDGVGGTYVYPATSSCNISDSGAPGSVSCAYTVASSSGITSMTVTRTSTTTGAWNMKLMEFSSDQASPTFDNLTTSIQTPASTAPTNPSITITGTNDVVAEFLRGGAGSAVAAPYTGFLTQNLTSGAYALNQASAPSCVWTTASGKAQMVGIAFKEPAAANVQPIVDIITENRPPQ